MVLKYLSENLNIRFMLYFAVIRYDWYFINFMIYNKESIYKLFNYIYIILIQCLDKVNY